MKRKEYMENTHPLLARKDGIVPEFKEEPLDIVFKEGAFTIKNVPHVVNDPMITGLDYTVRSSVEAKVSDIRRHMVERKLTEFDFNDYDQVIKK